MEGAGRSRGGKVDLNKREFAVSTWRQIGEPNVGEDELRRIQSAMSEAFGQRGLLSPAAIARILADEGAELRHPEIIEFDARWRESQIQLEAKKLNSLGAWSPESQLRLRQAESLIKKLEKLRRRFDRTGDDETSKQIRTLVIDARRAAILRVEGKLLDEAERAEQSEIADWFGIWLQTPNLFEQWLELRRASPDFREKFSAKD
jgi:hypothetical protein